jgi:hypothetical protein
MINWTNSLLFTGTILGRQPRSYYLDVAYAF